MRKQTLLKMKGIAALGLCIFMITALFTSLRPERNVDAAGEKKEQSEEISTAKGNGPQKVTKLIDMGYTSVASGVPNNQPASPSTITDGVNEVQFTNTSVYTDASNGMRSTSSSVSNSIQISMDRSWNLDIEGYVGAYDAVGYASGLSLNFSNSSNSASFAVSTGSDNPAKIRTMQASAGGKSQKKDLSGDVSKYYNKYNDLKIGYNSADRKFVFSFSDQTIQINSPFTGVNNVKLSISGSVSWWNDYTAPASVVKFKFKSFEYTDYHIKSDVTIQDYMDREITDAVGNGHKISVHPAVYNNAAGTQRYSGKIALDTIHPYNNLNLLGNLTNPIPFTHTADAKQDKPFNVLVQSGRYSSGQTFNLPLSVSDDYWSNTALQGLTGVPGTWYNLQNPENGQEQLPLRLNLKRDTYRYLVSDMSMKASPTSADMDYDHTFNGKPIEPNGHGWYNHPVTLNLYSDSGEFNELNAVKTTGGQDMTAANTLSGNSFVIPKSTEQTGDTYSIFARKGNNKTTEYLSAVTEETFRVDTDIPTIALNVDQASGQRTLKAADALSGIDYIRWRRTDGQLLTDYDDTYDDRIQIESNPASTAGDKNPSAASFKSVLQKGGTGNYEFQSVDLAGNVSDPVKVTNEAPKQNAEDAEVTYNDTITNSLQKFKPLTVHKANITDKEDNEQGKSHVPLDRIEWKIEKADDSSYPAAFIPRTGHGEDALQAPLPIGKYKVSFYLKDGTDTDGNDLTFPYDTEYVTLTVTANDPPVITPKDEISIDPVTTPKEDGTIHQMAQSEKTIIVDPEDPFSGGRLTKDEIEDDILKSFQFASQLFSPMQNLNISLIIMDDKGKNVTNTGIVTLKDGVGSYTATYCVTDAAGCSTTLQMTYYVKADVTVTFLPGKGDYSDGDSAKTTEVPIKKKLEDEQIPEETLIEPPVERCFIGWGEKSSDTNPVALTNIEQKADTTYYAIYAEDINRNAIPDYEEALFLFKCKDPAHAAYKYADKTVIGLPAPEGPTATVSLTTALVPEILFDRGYRLKGWLAEGEGEELLTTDALCELQRRRGTKTTVTAVIEDYPLENKGEVVITFFSSDPKNAPLKGGEGQTLILKTEKADEPVTIDESRFPEVNMGEGCELKGWKTEKTGDQILGKKQVSAKEFYGGETITCIAYVEAPVKKETAAPAPPADTKPKTVVKTETKLKKETVKEKETVTVKEKEKEETKKNDDELVVSKRGTNESKKIQDGGLTILGDTGGQVPLGGSPGNLAGGKACNVHFFMLLWILLIIGTVFYRLHRRKAEWDSLMETKDAMNLNGGELSDPNSWYTARPRQTDLSDYLIMVGMLILGVILKTTGNCFLELPLLIIGAAIILFFLVSMKMMDRKESKMVRQMSS